jgi:L-glutamine-phosphate cytidylyltransferase
MKAIILAAGRGSRMHNKTANRPKCLVKLRGRTLLEWQLEALRDAKVDSIGVVTGYKHELLEKWQLIKFHNPLWARTNMLSSLAYASGWLKENTCIVSYSDIFYGSSAVKSLMECDSPIAITYDPDWLDLWSKRFVDPLSDAETFRLNPNSTIAEIGNKPSSINEINGQYMGLLRITPEGWGEVERVRAGLHKEVRDNMQITKALQLIIGADRMPITALPFEGEWGEVDTPSDLALYQAY